MHCRLVRNPDVFAMASNSISHSFAARGAVPSCSGPQDAIDNVRSLTPHASRVNGIVSEVMIPWRFTYLSWNITTIWNQPAVYIKRSLEQSGHLPTRI